MGTSSRSQEASDLPTTPDSKRLTNRPIRQAGSVLKCPDDRKNRVVSAQMDELFAVDAEARRKTLTTAARHIRRQETASGNSETSSR